MKITDKKAVALIYELTVEGQIADKTTRERPLEFIQGMGYLLPLFEKNVEGKEEGDKFEFTLQPEDGYGKWESDRVVDLPKSAFEVEGEIREDLMVVGKVIPLMNAMGGVIPGKVLEVGPDTVKMDLNHPMAGKVLNFSGEIVSVREATQKELEEGLHGELVQKHECNCNCDGSHCGDCEGNCEGNCSEDGCKGGCDKH